MPNNKKEAYEQLLVEKDNLYKLLEDHGFVTSSTQNGRYNKFYNLMIGCFYYNFFSKKVSAIKKEYYDDESSRISIDKLFDTTLLKEVTDSYKLLQELIKKTSTFYETYDEQASLFNIAKAVGLNAREKFKEEKGLTPTTYLKKKNGYQDLFESFYKYLRKAKDEDAKVKANTINEFNQRIKKNVIKKTDDVKTGGNLIGTLTKCFYEAYTTEIYDFLRNNGIKFSANHLTDILNDDHLNYYLVITAFLYAYLERNPNVSFEQCKYEASILGNAMRQVFIDNHHQESPISNLKNYMLDPNFKYQVPGQLTLYELPEGEKPTKKRAKRDIL